MRPTEARSRQPTQASDRYAECTAATGGSAGDSHRRRMLRRCRKTAPLRALLGGRVRRPRRVDLWDLKQKATPDQRAGRLGVGSRRQLRDPAAACRNHGRAHRRLAARALRCVVVLFRSRRAQYRLQNREAKVALVDPQQLRTSADPRRCPGVRRGRRGRRTWRWRTAWSRRTAVRAIRRGGDESDDRR